VRTILVLEEKILRIKTSGHEKKKKEKVNNHPTLVFPI
jgi:hypothetical protein